METDYVGFKPQRGQSRLLDLYIYYCYVMLLSAALNCFQVDVKEVSDRCDSEVQLIEETISLPIRAKDVALSTTSNWFWNFVIGYITPNMVDESAGNPWGQG